MNRRSVRKLAAWPCERVVPPVPPHIHLRGLGRVRVPAVEENSDVVVPVEEDEGSLARHDEDRVDELGDLGVDEQLHPQAGGRISPVDLTVLSEW